MSDDKIQGLREKGRWSFAIKYGVLAWGIGTSLLLSIVAPLLPGVEYAFAQLLAITLPTCCASGMLFGLLMWRVLIAPDSSAGARQDVAGQPATRPESK